MSNSTATSVSTNHLYPIFLKTENLNIYLIGGGKVATEKLHFLLKNAPVARVTIIAPEIASEIREMAASKYNVNLLERRFTDEDLEKGQLFIVSTGDPNRNAIIHKKIKEVGKPVNVADTPALCDFYMGSIVTRGDLKIAISTNGKSPTLAKRLRELFEEALPEEIEEVLINLHTFRSMLKGNFSNKVKEMNQLTEVLIKKRENQN